jgi:hypothetical protein
MVWFIDDGAPAEVQQQFADGELACGNTLLRGEYTQMCPIGKRLVNGAFDYTDYLRGAMQSNARPFKVRQCG